MFNNADTAGKVVIDKLEKIYIQQWLVNINKQPKLRTYCKIKKEYKIGSYLLLFKQTVRSCLSKLRISAHTLEIERGRYVSPSIPPELRHCHHCKTGGSGRRNTFSPSL